MTCAGAALALFLSRVRLAQAHSPLACSREVLDNLTQQE